MAKQVYFMFENFNLNDSRQSSLSELRKTDAYKYLNTEQFKAATYSLSSFLVLAGAGSGKTSVLIKRLRYLIETVGLSGKDIMAVTFTNKAAAEIRNRAYGELRHIEKTNEVDDMRIGTFHSICLKMMKEYSQYLPMNAKEAEIIDEEAREALVLRLMEMGYLASGKDPSKYITVNQRFSRLLELAKREYEQVEKELAEVKIPHSPELFQLKDAIAQLEICVEMTTGERKSGKFLLLGAMEPENLSYVKEVISCIGNFKESGYRSSDLSTSPEYKRYYERKTFRNLTLPSVICRPMSAYDYYILISMFLYEEYESYMLDTNMLDFSDLLISMVEVFTHNENAREKVRKQFKAIMVDEFQDTNTLQYRWLKLITGEETAVMIVGDDDQSIYGFRGAHPEYMRYFLTDFKAPLATGLELPTEDYYKERHKAIGDLEVIKLEQNYRSTFHILDVANKAIRLNQNRMDKTLYTKKDPLFAEKVKVVTHTTPYVQASWVAQDILAQIEKSKNNPNMEPLTFKDFAVIYRNNASSSAVDRAFVKFNIPHIIYGGYNFYKRKEIRDSLVWLNLALNPDNDIHFEAALNQIPLTKRPNPVANSEGVKRAFEPRMMKYIKDESKRTSTTFVMALLNIGKRFDEELKEGKISTNAIMRDGIYAEFINDKLMMKIGQSCSDYARFLAYVIEPINKSSNFAEAVNNILMRCQNLQYNHALLNAELKKEKEDRDSPRKSTNANKIKEIERYLENVKIFIDSAKDEYTAHNDRYQGLTIAEQIREWLQEIALLTDKENATKTDRVTMMTVHSSKGLEFNRVYLIDVNAKNFPSERGDPEEEMRLYYVGVTRAKEELVVSSISTPSNFVDYTLRMKENIIDLGAFSGYMIENLKSEDNPNGYSLRDSMMSRDGLSNIAKKDYDVLQKRSKQKDNAEKIPFFNHDNRRERWKGTTTKQAGQSVTGNSLDTFNEMFGF